MLIVGFAAVGALAALGAAFGGLALWKALLIGLAGFIGANLIYLLWLWVRSLFVDDTKPITRQSRICRRGCVGVSVMATRYCWVRTHVTGKEKLPKEGRFVLVSNHRSMFDPLVMADKLRDCNISFISKISNMHLPVVGRMSYGAGFLPIDRENDRKALVTILTAADYIKKDFCSMAVYPEGSRSKTGELMEFHAGSFKIAQKAGVPLVIASLDGTELVSKNCFRRATDVYLDILEVIPADEVKRRTTTELSAYSRGLIEENLKKRAEERAK